jgi:hypothetical protein
MPHVTFPNPDGSLAILIPVDTTVPLEEIIARSLPPGTPHCVCDSIDRDPAFHDAYDFDSTTGSTFIPDRGKEVQLNLWREFRKPLLEKLDIAFTKALESNDTTAMQEIAAKKQALRDVTKTQLPNDLAGIKSTFPSILNP